MFGNVRDWPSWKVRMGINVLAAFAIVFLLLASWGCIFVGIATGASPYWLGSIGAVLASFSLLLSKPLMRIFDFYYRLPTDLKAKDRQACKARPPKRR